jgi:hypothetical protein
MEQGIQIIKMPKCTFYSRAITQAKTIQAENPLIMHKYLMYLS